jgi:hypothetical protein
MRKSEKQMTAELLRVYNEQCPTVKIKYSVYDITVTEARICLENWIEIVHFTNYQGGYAIKFLALRGGEENFFDTYSEAINNSI